jgi:outer membrane biosynthesis protein TonB
MNAMLHPAAHPMVGRLAAATLLSVGLHGAAAMWLSPFPSGSNAQERDARSLSLVSLRQGEEPKRVRALSPEAAAGIENGGGLTVAKPRYFNASELDRRPIALLPVDPEYPQPAPKHASLVVLAVFINEAGTVDRVVPLTDTPGDPLRESAAAAFSRARFAPGLRNGAPVKSRMLVEVRFEGAKDDPPQGPSASK